MRSMATGIVFAACLVIAPVLRAAPLGNAFTYQSQLKQNGSRVNDTCDCQFSLWDDPAAGIQVGPTLTFNGVGGNPPPIDVADGLLVADLNFGAGAFGSQARWLQIAVACPSGGALTPLSPRQAITAAPAAQFALESSQWQSSGSAIINANTGFVGINRDYTVGLEWFGVHAPVPSGYGGMYVTTEGETAWPFYGYKAGTQSAWTYLDGGDGDWHVNVDGNKLTVTDEGQVGIRTSSPAYPLHVVSTNTDRTIHGENSTATGVGVRGQATHASGANTGVYGETLSTSGTAVSGFAAAASGETVGGRFVTQSAGGTGVIVVGGLYGVSGSAFPSSGETWGGFFQNQAPNGAGVIGIANHSTGTASGMRGQTASTNGTGVLGTNTAASGTTYGVRGSVNSATGYAGYFEGGRNYFQGRVGIGTSSPANPLSVAGDADLTGRVSIGITGADARLLVRGVTGEDAFRVRVEGSTKLLVKDNGGVGIGSNFGTVPADGLRVLGNVGIGIDPTDKLHVSGNIRATGSVFASCGTLVCSDERYKTNLKPVESALELIQSLRPVRFDWKREQFPDQHFSGDRQLGLIAQEVQKTVPEVVQKGSDGYLAVDYGRLTPLLAEAIKEVQEQKDTQIAALRAEKDRQLRQRDAEITALRAEKDREIADLATRLERIEKMLVSNTASKEESK